MIDSEPKRDAMRLALAQSFETYHLQRRRRRLAVQAAGLLVVVSLGIGLVVRSSSRAPDPVDERTVQTQPAPSPEVTSSQESSPGAAKLASTDIDPSRYEHMKLRLLSEEDVASTLNQVESEWVLVTINGEPQAFSTRQANARSPRSNSRNRAN
jgi:hypothetical protein